MTNPAAPFDWGYTEMAHKAALVAVATPEGDKPMNTLDRAREMVRRKFEEGVDVSEIKTYLIAYYGSTLPEIAIMAYHGNERIDAMLIVAARYWVRANSKIAD